jgi:hypothetical protein
LVARSGGEFKPPVKIVSFEPRLGISASSDERPSAILELVEFLFEHRGESRLPLDALGAIEPSPIHLLLVRVRPLAHFRENVVTERGYVIEHP